jgi:hypothetical protein
MNSDLMKSIAVGDTVGAVWTSAETGKFLRHFGPFKVVQVYKKGSVRLDNGMRFDKDGKGIAGQFVGSFWHKDLTLSSADELRASLISAGRDPKLYRL